MTTAPEPYRFVFSVVLLTLGAASVGFQQGHAQSLELVEERAIPLPERATVTRGVLGDDGSILLWGPQQAWSIRGGAAEPLCDDPVRDALAGSILARYRVEMIIGSPDPRLLHSTPEGCRTTEFGRDVPPLLAAAYVGERRLGVDGGGSIIEMMLDGSIGKVKQQSVALAQLVQTGSDTLPLWMAPALGGFLLGMQAPPFVWLHARLDGQEMVANPLSSDSVRSVEMGVSTGVVQVDDHYVQVVADLRSTARWLLLFNGEGRPVKETRIGIPFGLLGVNPRIKKLLVLRRTDRLEVAVYAYSWNGDGGR